jgi:uncharacterized protein (DUF433 family)
MEHIDWKARIASNPAILGGKPVIKGTRIAIEFILDLLAHGWSYDEILTNYPNLKREDILAALEYSAHNLRLEEVRPL